MEPRIRAMTRGAYALQKLRIQTGGRVVANFKQKLGIKPGTKEDESESKAKEILDDLRASYVRITDGISLSDRKEILSRLEAEEKGDGLISDYTEFCLVAQYLLLETSEKRQFTDLAEALRGIPIWEGYLKDVKGIGPAMAGVLISELSIEKAKYPSSFRAYAGLDVVGGWRLDEWQWLGNIPELESDLYKEIVGAIPAERPLHSSEDGQLRYEPGSIAFDENGPKLTVVLSGKGHQVAATYRWEHSGGRSRRREHLVEVEYTDAKGETKKKLSLTYNPFLKSKLMGVLAASFLRVADSPYRRVYDEYKFRLENHAIYGIAQDDEMIETKEGKKVRKTSKARRHMMACRYMIQRFLTDLHIAWRGIEGLPVSKEYSEAKLGLKHDEGVSPAELENPDLQASCTAQGNRKTEVSRTARGN